MESESQITIYEENRVRSTLSIAVISNRSSKGNNNNLPRNSTFPPNSTPQPPQQFEAIDLDLYNAVAIIEQCRIRMHEAVNRVSEGCNTYYQAYLQERQGKSDITLLQCSQWTGLDWIWGRIQAVASVVT